LRSQLRELSVPPVNHEFAVDDNEHGVARILFADDSSAGWKGIFLYDAGNVNQLLRRHSRKQRNVFKKRYFFNARHRGELTHVAGIVSSAPSLLRSRLPFGMSCFRPPPTDVDRHHDAAKQNHREREFLSSRKGSEIEAELGV